jgi:hypothetical protein
MLLACFIPAQENGQKKRFFGISIFIWVTILYFQY